MTFFIDQRVVVTQFFAGFDFHQRINIDATVFMLHRFAIGLAGMIDEARFIAAAAAIDDAAIVEAEEVSMVQRALGIRPVQRPRPWNPLALVFDYASARRDHAAGKNAGAVYGRGFDYVQRCRRIVDSASGQGFQFDSVSGWRAGRNFTGRDITRIRNG